MKFNPLTNDRLIKYLGLEALMLEYRALNDEENAEQVADYTDQIWFDLTDEEMWWIDNRSVLIGKTSEIAENMGKKNK